MDIVERLEEIKKLGNGIDINTVLLWYKHGAWLLEQVIKVEHLEYINNRVQKENDSLCDKLADIRNLFDDSDMKAEGHGMEDMIASPYAVVCYAENKIKRLMQTVEDQQEELAAWRSEGMI